MQFDLSGWKRQGLRPQDRESDLLCAAHRNALA